MPRWPLEKLHLPICSQAGVFQPFTDSQCYQSLFFSKLTQIRIKVVLAFAWPWTLWVWTAFQVFIAYLYWLFYECHLAFWLIFLLSSLFLWICRSSLLNTLASQWAHTHPAGDPTSTGSSCCALSTGSWGRSRGRALRSELMKPQLLPHSNAARTGKRQQGFSEAVAHGLPIKSFLWSNWCIRKANENIQKGEWDWTDLSLNPGAITYLPGWLWQAD